ncbi:MAG: 50S ribosomal protein L10 [Armatimonadota bacterium]|nr:50S ribosomal protein L10 [Armatimonadota bacterium]
MATSEPMVSGAPAKRWEPRAGGKKKEQVAQIRRWISESRAQILLNYHGLSVREITDLRRQLRQVGAELHVVKNTLYRVARDHALPEGLEPHLHGMTAIAFVKGDEAAAAKAVVEYIKQARKPEVKALLLGERVYPAEMVETLAKLPARDVMIAQFLGALQSPIAGLVGTLSEILAQFVRTLQAIADKKAQTQS